MLPILYRTPWFFVYSFTAVYTLALLLGVVITGRLAQRWGWVDGLLLALALALLLGRLTFVAAQWSYFQERPSDMWRLWQGGFTYHGVLVGALLGLWLWARWQKRPLWPLLDLLTPLLCWLSAAGWLACWLEGCAYGLPTTLGLFAADLPDNLGVFAVRYQVQWLGVAWSLLVLALVWRWRRQVGNGRLFLVALLLLSLGRVALMPLRGDTAVALANWRLDGWLDSGFALLGLLLLQYRRRVGLETAVRQQDSN